MEKLKKLFKQHKRETGTSYEYILFRDYDAGLQARCIDDGKEIYIVRQAEILSKKMGFIKWLVENNKIDIERLHKIVDYRLEIKENYFNAHDYNSDCLLMLLSISDTPIEDLICYLKIS